VNLTHGHPCPDQTSACAQAGNAGIFVSSVSRCAQHKWQIHQLLVNFLGCREGMNGIALVAGKDEAGYVAEVFIVELFG